MQDEVSLYQHRTGMIPGFFILLLITLAAVFLYLTNKLHQVQEQKTDIFLQEIMLRSADRMRIQLQCQLHKIEAVSEVLARAWPMPESRLRDELAQAAANLKIKRLGVILADGSSIVSDGAHLPLRDRPFVPKVMGGESVISESFPDRDDNLSINILAAPLSHRGRVAAALFATVDSNELQRMLDLPIFDGEGGMHIVDRDGQSVGDDLTGIISSNNLFTALQSMPRVRPSLQQVQSDFQTMATGTVSFRHKSTDYNMAYAPLGINDWYAVGFMPTAYTDASIGTTITIILGMLAFTTLAFFGLVGYIVFIQRRMRRDAQQHAARMATLVRNVPGGVLRCRDDDAWTLLDYSEGFLDMVGYTAEELRTKFHNELAQLIYPADLNTVRNNQHDLGTGFLIQEFRLQRKSGSLLWVSDHSQLVEDEDGMHWCSVLLDVGVRRNAQERRRVEEERYRILFEMSDAILYEFDLRSGVMHTTRQFFEKFGFPEPESVSHQYPVKQDIIHPEDEATFASLHQALKQGENSTEALIRIRDAEGKWLWCHMQQTALLDANHKCIKALGKITNVDAETRALHKLRDEVQRDPFTGLFNKVATTGVVDQLLHSPPQDMPDSPTPQGPMLSALCLVDVDNFKKVNDFMGHEMGDSVLLELSAALTSLFPQNAVVGRVGGDEFIIFLHHLTSITEVEERMAQVCAAFRHNFDYTSGSQICISASIGIALCPRDGTSFAVLYPKADKALYRSKRRKDIFSVYDARLDEEQ